MWKYDFGKLKLTSNNMLRDFKFTHAKEPSFIMEHWLGKQPNSKEKVAFRSEKTAMSTY